MEHTEGPFEETFEGCLQSARLVRAFVMAKLASHPRRDDVVLVAHEFAANAVRHATTAKFKVELALHGNCVRVSVIADSSHSGIPHVKDPAGASENGRGLYLVEALAEAWGFTPNGRDMTVWAVLGLAPTP
jgi:anti-sigma regulatory factor (Ser/Thr protein kinase)